MSEGESTSENNDNISFKRHVKREIANAKDDITTFGRIAWLTMYNLFQSICHAIILGKLMFELFNKGIDASTTFYNEVSDLLFACQIVAFAEILHPLLGVVKTGVIPSLLQICGHSFVVFVLIIPVKEMHTNFTVFILLSLLSMTEIIRYPFYLLTLHRINSSFIKWVRYTIWLPIYPSGILCEVIIMLQSLPIVESPDQWENATSNVTMDLSSHYFSLAALIKCVLPIYIALSLYLINHMWNMRHKKLIEKIPTKID